LSGSYMGYPFLDPLAGLLVSGVILKQVNFILINVLSALSDF
jgi:divalent metal cation (Fe/Co/Zn/Cd) transporter